MPFEKRLAFLFCIGSHKLGRRSWCQAAKAVTGLGDIVGFSEVVLFSLGPSSAKTTRHSRIVLVEGDSLQEGIT